MTAFKDMSDDQLFEAMREEDDKLPDGLVTNPEARGTPHNEFFKRSVRAAFGGDK